MNNEIYQVVEEALRRATEPVTCVNLMEQHDVRKAALDEFGSDVQLATNKLSDTLGFMWRRGAINRHPAPRGGSQKARYAYSWPVSKPASPALPAPCTRQKMKIVEQGDKVTIELNNVTITITTR